MRKKKPQIITVAAIKGGVAKTTTAAALVQAAAKDSKKALAIDLDPQADLSFWLNADFNLPGSYDLLTGTDPAECVQESESGIALIAGGANLEAIKTSPGSAKRLQTASETLQGQFDLVVIDTAPSFGELQNNALYSSTGLLIPLTTSALALQGLYQIVDVERHIEENRPGLHIIGVTVTQYDGRANVNKFMLETIKEKCDEMKIPYLGEIRNGVAIAEAAAMQQNIFDYCPKSKPAQDYYRLYTEIMGAKK